MIHLKTDNISKEEVEALGKEAHQFLQTKLCGFIAQEITQRITDLRTSDAEAAEKVGGINAYLDLDSLIRGGIHQYFQALLHERGVGLTKEDEEQELYLKKENERQELRKLVRAEN